MDLISPLDRPRHLLFRLRVPPLSDVIPPFGFFLFLLVDLSLLATLPLDLILLLHFLLFGKPLLEKLDIVLKTAPIVIRFRGQLQL